MRPILFLSLPFIALSFRLSPSSLLPSSYEKFISDHVPKTITEGSRTIHIYPKNRIEVVLSFGTTDSMIRVAESAIEEFYTDNPQYQGEQTDNMARVMEQYFGGYWSVVISEDPYDSAFTIVRRSPSFMNFDVNGAGVLIAREGA